MRTASITLDGDSLTIEQLAAIARDPSIRVERDPSTDERVARSEELIHRIVSNYSAQWDQGGSPATEYGVTTGFGEFKDRPIAPEHLEELQRNLLLSHSVGVGDNTDSDDLRNYFPAEVVRAALATRLNAFLKGHSGVRRTLVDIVQRMLNRGIIPLVPLRGSVGASGDLCPLSHLFALLVGSGRFYVAGDSRLQDAAALPELLGVDAEEMRPRFKEGLALVNGANFSAGMLAIAVHDAEQLANVADDCAALTLEALCGCTRALDPKVHEERGHPGQMRSAERMRRALEGSRLVERTGAVQDAYSLRCAPQVHGASRDTILFVRSIAEREINAATDNPLFFPDGDEPFDLQFAANWPTWYHGEQRLAYSAGNFHGQPLALGADFLAIAVAELANISERRSQMLLDGNHNRGLPKNLAARAGVNSGLMIAQYTAASLVSENKVLCHPASVDSIPTAANSEDHVSMSTHAARKLRSVIANAEAVLAIEAMVGAQAVEWRTASIEGIGGAETMEQAERQAEEFTAKIAGQSARVAERLGKETATLYRRVREHIEPVIADRPLSDDVRRLRQVLFGH
ncbi:MAG TPA: histidine ammonia-lyase [Thermoanaerobaculia bacterium]|nr:histidine ammonia-lyase [Thermoanaerobaculia bacterium]